MEKLYSSCVRHLHTDLWLSDRQTKLEWWAGSGVDSSDGQSRYLRFHFQFRFCCPIPTELDVDSDSILIQSQQHRKSVDFNSTSGTVIFPSLLYRKACAWQLIKASTSGPVGFHDIFHDYTAQMLWCNPVGHVCLSALRQKQQAQ